MCNEWIHFATLTLKSVAEVLVPTEVLSKKKSIVLMNKLEEKTIGLEAVILPSRSRCCSDRHWDKQNHSFLQRGFTAIGWRGWLALLHFNAYFSFNTLHFKTLHWTGPSKIQIFPHKSMYSIHLYWMYWMYLFIKEHFNFTASSATYKTVQYNTVQCSAEAGFVHSNPLYFTSVHSLALPSHRGRNPSSHHCVTFFTSLNKQFFS